MFTLSAFSTFLKLIPMNHIETKSFLFGDKRKDQCWFPYFKPCQHPANTMDTHIYTHTQKQYLLATVFLGAGEGLGVDVGQGDVLIPLQVPHQHSDLGLDQANPKEGPPRRAFRLSFTPTTMRDGSRRGPQGTIIQWFVSWFYKYLNSVKAREGTIYWSIFVICFY